MLAFATPQGADLMGVLRLDVSRLPPIRREAPIQFLAAAPSEECGCPEELWLVHGVLALIYFEADGSSEAHFDGGDWEQEIAFHARDMPELRAAAFRWVETLSDRDEDLGGCR